MDVKRYPNRGGPEVKWTGDEIAKLWMVSSVQIVADLSRNGQGMK